MMVGFAFRIAIVLAVILGAGAAMTGVLSIHKFERTFADLLTSRFQFVENDIRQRIETQMDLGLALVNLESVTEEMEAYLRNDEQILSIEVFDETGTVLYSTDPSFVGDLVSEDWVIAWRTNRSKSFWSALENDAGVVGVPLRNNLDQDVGSLALRYSREFLDHSVSEQIERLLLVGGGVGILMVVLSFIGCAILLRDASQDLKIIGNAMEDIAKRKKDSAALQKTLARHPEFAAFADSALGAQDILDSATKEIHQLDEEAI